jgi:hypothetical protein
MHHSGHLLRTATVATRNSVPTRRRRDLTPHRAAAIRRPRAPTQHLAAVTPPQVAAPAAVEVTEAEVAAALAEAAEVAAALAEAAEVAAALAVAEAVRLPTLITKS